LLAPGFAQVLIHPQPGGGLNAAQGYYISASGVISNAWTYSNDVFNLTVTIPPNTTAQICVPTTNASAITESGVPAINSAGVTYVGCTNNVASYHVGSGTYVFSSPLFVPVAPPVTNFVNNWSFEANVVSGRGGIFETVPVGWTAFNEAGASDIGSQWASGSDYVVNTPMAAPAAGNQYCYVNMFNASTTGGIFQDIGAVQPNTFYTLTVAIGSRQDRLNSPGIISLVNGADVTGAVLASGGGLPSVRNTWQNYSVSCATGAAVSGDLSIVLSALGNGTTIQADFDNVQLTVVPLKVPVLGTPKIAGGYLLLTASGGTAGAGYTWLASTNLSAPGNWTTNRTGTLDVAGGFSNAIPINPGQPACFFKLRIP